MTWPNVPPGQKELERLLEARRVRVVAARRFVPLIVKDGVPVIVTTRKPTGPGWPEPPDIDVS